MATGEGRVIIGGDRGKITLAKRQGAGWSTEFLARDTGKIRGVAIADIDPLHPGAEMYACGYSRNVTVLAADEHGCWTSKVIYTAGRPLHHLLAGEFDAAHDGPELSTCRHGGRPIAPFPRR